MGAFVLCSVAANATSVQITNPSFESPDLPNGAFQSGAPTGWSTANGATNVVAWNPGAPYPNSYYTSPPPGGKQILALGGNFSSGQITQNLGVTLQPNTTYTVTYWVGARLDLPISSYNVQLLAGGAALAADHLGNPPAGGWVQRTFTYQSGAVVNGGGQLSIMLLGTGRNYADGVAGQVNLDVITLDVGTPGLSLGCPSAAGTVGVPYNSALAGGGGQPPLTYSILSGTLAGLTLNQNTGAISGTPGTMGPYSFNAQVVDSATPTAASATANCSLTISTVSSVSATYVKTDATTQGSWKGAYGADGAMIVADSTNLPGYAQVALTGQQPYTWFPSTQDVRALQKGASGSTDRIASTWYNAPSSSFTIDVMIGGSTPQPVALYAVDWDVAARSERIDVIDPSNNHTLDTRTISGFSNGVFIVWNVTGHVQFVVTRLNGPNAVISGLFFGSGQSGPPTAPSITQNPVNVSVYAGQTATFAVAATGTAPLNYQWQSAPSGSSNFTNISGATNASYTTPTLAFADSGTQFRCVVSNGVNPPAISAIATVTVTLVAPSITQNPSSASINVGQSAVFTVAATGSAPLAYQWQSAPSGSSTFTNINGAASSSYPTPALALSDSCTKYRCVVSNGVNPAATSTAATVTVSVPANNAATFVSSDSATHGTWKGPYGSDGFWINSDVMSLPGYAAVSVTGTSYIWAPSIQDPTCLQKGANGATDRICSVWYGASSFVFDVNITGGGSHQVGLYALDWDGSNRFERIDAIDPSTGNTLDTRMVSGFSAGLYLVWNVSGHVQFRVTNAGGPNAVISGIFFGPPQTVSPPVITQNPSNVSVTAGQTAVFTVSASGIGISYQWQSKSSGGATFTNIAGATGSSYTTPSTALSDNGSQYRCVVTNSSASPTSTAATLTVSAPTLNSGVSFVTTDTTTQGAWTGIYGSKGYMITGYNTVLPSFATAALIGTTVWNNGQTADPAAPQTGGGNGVEACWYAGAQFGIDLNPSDSATHQFALYTVDWLNGGRVESISISDAATGTVLDTKTASSFQGGQYFVWNFHGHVTMTITRTAGPNPVASGLFFQ